MISKSLCHGQNGHDTGLGWNLSKLPRARQEGVPGGIFLSFKSQAMQTALERSDGLACSNCSAGHNSKEVKTESEQGCQEPSC